MRDWLAWFLVVLVCGCCEPPGNACTACILVHVLAVLCLLQTICDRVCRVGSAHSVLKHI
jgi:hypothetical protein